MPPIGQLIFFIAIIAIFWLFLIRPAKRQQRAQAQLHAALMVGDEIVLSSGIFGRIMSLDDDKAEVEIAPGTVITVARQVVVRRLEDEVDHEATAPESHTESHTEAIAESPEVEDSTETTERPVEPPRS